MKSFSPVFIPGDNIYSPKDVKVEEHEKTYRYPNRRRRLPGTQRCGEIQSVPIVDAVKNLKLIDPEGRLARCAEELGMMLGR